MDQKPNWQESTSYQTGLAEIQFTSKPGGPDLTDAGVSLLGPTHTATKVALASNLFPSVLEIKSK